jgi:hypothetical protein
VIDPLAVLGDHGAGLRLALPDLEGARRAFRVLEAASVLVVLGSVAARSDIFVENIVGSGSHAAISEGFTIDCSSAA